MTCTSQRLNSDFLLCYESVFATELAVPHGQTAQSNFTCQCCTFTFLLAQPFKIKGSITFATNEVVYLLNFLVDLNWEKNRPCIAEHIISISKNRASKLPGYILCDNTMPCSLPEMTACWTCKPFKEATEVNRPHYYTLSRNVMEFKSDIIFNRRLCGDFTGYFLRLAVLSL